MNDTPIADDLSIRTLTLTVRQQAYLIGHLSERVTALEAASSPQDTLNRRLKALDEKWSAGGLTCDELDERAWLVKRINSMPQTFGNAYTSPEGWEAKQKAVEARCGYDELGEAHKYLDTLGVPRSEHPNARLCLQGRIDWLRHAPQISEDAKIGKAWREDSSLEKWFPFTAEELKKANEELKKLKELNVEYFKSISDYANKISLEKYKVRTLLQSIDRYLSHDGYSKNANLLTEARADVVNIKTDYLPEPESKWRDAKTDPPTKCGYYIVHFAVAGRVTPLEFNGVYWLYSDTKTPLGNPNTVTHWQELPPPPQATEKA